MAHLGGLSNLRELRLDHTLITDAAIQHLLGLQRLERLNLAETVVTAEGAAASSSCRGSRPSTSAAPGR